jgi:alpha-amylase
MDYETFGEHQWEDKGIFEFLEHLPEKWLAQPGNTFMSFTEAIDKFEPKDEIDIPQTITWADTERDLTAWVGNKMQQEAIAAVYELSGKILSSDDPALIDDWRRLQTSDHFYYMCTNFMNVYHDLKWRAARSVVPA